MAAKFTNKTGKNLILLKDAPSITLDNREYKRLKGTVYQWGAKYDKSWSIIGEADGEATSIDISDYLYNKGWYGLTTKNPTYEVLSIGGEAVMFRKGYVKIGCRSIKNSLVKKIASKLIK